MTDAIIDAIINAYHVGLLQYDEMSVCNVKVNMKMFTRFNILTFNYCGVISTINVYDNDSLYAQEISIDNTIRDLITMVDSNK